MNGLLFSQIFDTSFPNGTYAHSYGLEGYVVNPGADELSFPERVYRYVLRYLEVVLARGELPLFFDLAHLASPFLADPTLIQSKESWMDRARFYGTKCLASLPTVELRTAFITTGSRTLELFLDVTPNDLLLAYASAVKLQNMPPWIWAMISALPLDDDDTIDEVAALGCFSSIKTMVINAQRLGALGHRNTQLMLSRFAKQIPSMIQLAKSIDVEDAINVSMVIEESQYRHVTLTTKLFST